MYKIESIWILATEWDHWDMSLQIISSMDFWFHINGSKVLWGECPLVSKLRMRGRGLQGGPRSGLCSTESRRLPRLQSTRRRGTAAPATAGTAASKSWASRRRRRTRPGRPWPPPSWPRGRPRSPWRTSGLGWGLRSCSVSSSWSGHCPSSE